MTAIANPRIQELSDEQASTEAKGIFEATRQRIGQVPNVYRALAHAPNLLAAFTHLSDAVDTSSLDRSLQQQIAVLIAQFDGSTYCLAINTAVGLHVGATSEQLREAQRGRSTNSQTNAALSFVAKLLQARGAVEDIDVENLRKAGFGEQQLTEILGCVGLNLFANYFNLVARTSPDFPPVDLA